MEFVYATLFLTFLLAVLGLHIFSLPANWILLGLTGLWALAHPAHPWGGLFVLLCVLAVSGEVVEFIAQYYGGKRFGASGKGNLGGLLGALGGALLGAPFFFGLGALFGALFGAYAGCYLFERIHGKNGAEANRAAWGALYGKAFGMVMKIGLGMVMWLAVIRDVWP